MFSNIVGTLTVISQHDMSGLVSLAEHYTVAENVLWIREERGTTYKLSLLIDRRVHLFPNTGTCSSFMNIILRLKLFFLITCFFFLGSVNTIYSWDVYNGFGQGKERLLLCTDENVTKQQEIQDRIILNSGVLFALSTAVDLWDLKIMPMGWICVFGHFVDAGDCANSLNCALIFPFYSNCCV